MDSEGMDIDNSSSSPDTVTNDAYPVCCIEELLQPFFTDESLQVAMKPQPSPSPRPKAECTPVSPLPELRLVLLGRKGAGKSAAGNIVLGGGFEVGKPTEECVKRRADVAGRKVMVVDTPGWDWYYPLNSTPNWVRREIIRSVSLCPPGPHAVLLVVRSCASVNEDYITEIGEHLELLGTKVWEHTMVLFTRGDELGLMSMEQRIQTSGPGLQTLLQKCGNRYHVVENKTKGDGTQVKELVRKLEEMVAEKEERWKHLEMDAALLLELEADGKRRARERRKKQRQMEAQVQRGTIKTALMSDSLQISEANTRQSFSKTPRRLPEVRLVLLGERETGKSSAGNAILGQPGLFESGTVSEECVRHQTAVSMRLVTVVDTPGWDGGVMGSTPERVKREIVSSVALCPPGPHALLVTLRVDTVVRESHVQEHLELLGEGVWRHTILLFTHGDQLREGVDIKQHIQKGGKDLQSLLEKCRGRYHMIGSFNRLQNTTQVTELLEKVEEMASRNRCEAFSGLVQEVKTLSHQRNEKFNQRFKELQDKMLRQEVELKNMRDRETKSLRWFFDRRKKVKSPGNPKKEEEDDEEKRSIDRKYDIEELEERMRLLTEDKEREIQDLNVEHERILAALHQGRREAEEAGLNLELKEREIEELQERIDEQQLKLIDLERLAVGHEHEKKRYDEAVKEWEKVVHKLQQSIHMVNAEWKGRVDMLKAEMDDAKRHFKGELERTLLEKNLEMSETEVKLIKQTETMLTEKDRELVQERKIINEEKQRALDRVKQNEEEMQRKLEKMTGQHQKEIDEIKFEMKEEMDRKIHDVQKILAMAKVQHMEEVETNVKQHHSEINEKLREIEMLKEQSAKEAKTQKELKQRELDELEQKYLKIIKEKLCEHEKEKEIILTNHKKTINEKDKEMSVFKEQLQEEMAREKCEVEKAMRDETARKVKEKEDEIERLIGTHVAAMFEFENSREKYVMERDREIEDLKCRYMVEINEKNKEIEQILREKEKDIEELKVVVNELKQKEQKQMVELDCISEMQTKLESRATEVTELKECLREKEETWGATEAVKEQERKQIEQKLKEKEWIIQQLHEKLQDIEQMLQEKEDERGQILLNQKKEAELQLQLRDKEMDEIKQQLLKETERCVESMKMIEKQTREIAEAQRVLASKEAEIEEAVKTQERYVKEIEELKECVRSVSETEERYRNKEAELMEKIQEKDKDLDQMRLTIEQTKAELNNLTQKMEREMTKMIQEYERGIERRNEEIESFVKEKDAVIKGLEEEQRQKVLEVTEKYEESQKRMEELEIKTAEGIRELQMKCEQLREECEEKEQQVQIKEREIKNICKNNDRDVLEMGETNKKLQTEIERMKEMFEKEMRELKEQLKEKQLEVTLKDNEIKEGDLAEKLKEIEIWKKKKQEFEQKALRFDCKQEELKQREIALEAKQNEQDEKDRLEQERRSNIEQKEKELEELLKALEAKQMELNFHGQDLQKKVRGLKELNGREVNLRKQEQELMNWTSELNVQNEQVSSTTQQLDKMGRDLALLKEELRQKEKKLKIMSKNLNKWEMSLQEREAELSKRQQSDSENVKCGSDDNIELMYQDIGVEKETGKDSTREDQSVKMAEQSSTKVNNCHFETLQKEGGLKSQKPESVKVIRDFEAFGKSPRNYKESGDQVLTVLMLRESWSSCSPAGVSLLGAGEVSELNGSSFRSWRGQIAEQSVSVVEPLGLKWRDGPGLNTSEQSQNILKALSWSETGPDVVLLVTPAFLTCTEMYRKAVEEQVRLVGNEVWKRTMVLFTWGQTLGVSAEQHIRGNQELRRLIERCGGRFHVLRSKKSKLATEELFNKMANIVASNKRQNLVA